MPTAPTFDATATPIGAPRPRITRSALDDRSYTIDCAPLLREHELLVRVLTTTPPIALLPDTAPPGLRIHRAAIGGTCKVLLLDLAEGSPAAGRPSQDWPVSVSIKTTQGHLTVALLVRVHA